MNNWPIELNGAMDIELNKGLAAVIREQVIHATRVALLAEGFDTEFITDSEILELVKQTTRYE
tara:strand:- start:222 stop:410 length:189 start_codon:yes stop_codon:yes gene_type:complete